jgi:hypothetical protein
VKPPSEFRSLDEEAIAATKLVMESLELTPVLAAAERVASGEGDHLNQTKSHPRTSRPAGTRMLPFRLGSYDISDRKGGAAFQSA